MPSASVPGPKPEIVVELRRDEVAGGPVITGFAGQGFRVGERTFPNGILIDSIGVVDWVAPGHAGLLELDMLAGLLAQETPPEFLLLGTGARLERPLAAFVRQLEARGIGLEAMDSRAAARAWGVLRQEGRQIVGALMPLDAKS